MFTQRWAIAQINRVKKKFRDIDSKMRLTFNGKGVINVSLEVKT